jgi:replicative DNA helicase
MEKSSNRLYYKHISKAADEIVTYIDERRTGKSYSLRTKWKKFNKACNGGIEANTIYTIAGISGSGKSSFANSLENDLFDLNARKDFVVLSFNFEMVSSKQVGRKLSYKLKKTTSELYSGTSDTKVSDEEFKKIKEQSEKIKNYPIYYVDFPGTVTQIKETILSFMKEDFAKGKWVVIMLDHTLLTKGEAGDSERKVLSELQRMLMEVKKYGKNTIIQLSQMNRDIEDSNRVTNPSLHFPMRKDIFGGDSIYQASDLVFVLHRPEIIGIKAYGQSAWPTENYVYLHIIKHRDGEPKILQFWNNLKYNSIEDVKPNLDTSKN